MDQYDVAVLATTLLLSMLLRQVMAFWSLWNSEPQHRKPRRLRPRTPQDCPYCQQEHESICFPLVQLRRQPTAIPIMVGQSVLSEIWEAPKSS